MRPRTLIAAGLLALSGTGCGGAQSSYVRSPDTVLGRVVIYRNGVAYFERSATVEGDTLRLAVPAERVDDFLRSLTVIDADTGQPAPVSYPTSGARQGGSRLIDMKIGLSGAATHRLKLSYVTESPSWKPSYRLVMDKPGKVDVQGWAIVDNTSGEDWNRIKLGVGSSSAMSFRYDLHTVRTVERETLRSNDLFAQAPPVGGATYGQVGGTTPVLAELSDSSLASETAAADGARTPAPAPVQATRVASAHAASKRSRKADAPGELMENEGSGAARGAGGVAGKKAPMPRSEIPAAPPPPPPSQISAMAQRLLGTRDQIIVEGFADRGDGDKNAASLARASRVREQLIRDGVPSDRVVAVGRGDQPGHAGGVRVVQAPPPAPPAADKQGQAKSGHAAEAQAQDPIGTAHFESDIAMNVPGGSSAMVSILEKEADGEVVYLFDPESQHGDESFPFKAIRLRNPTDSVLESGPVTVFSAGRFIGEGLVEPIPARSVAFVPFALDRQVVVERKSDERDEIARIITVQRGVFSTEAKHTRRTTLTLFNRQDEKSVVYIRHTVQPGYKLTKAPAVSERMGLAHLFRVELAPKGKTEVEIEEVTPVFKTTDVRAADGMDLVRVYLLSAAANEPLRKQVADLLKLQKETANIEQQIETTREQMQEYRTRMDELHGQILSLREVRTGAVLLTALEKKMKDISDKVSGATIALVNLQETLMISRVHFQDAVAELTLETPAPEHSAALD
jgi:flagellar biosynthesis chaperone FliJ